MLTAGRLRDRIEIQTRVVTKTALGNSESWDTSRTLWGRMSATSVSSRARFQQIYNTEVTHQVVFRGRQSLSASNNRLKWRDAYYQIIGPVNDIAGLGAQTIIAVKKLDEGYA